MKRRFVVSDRAKRDLRAIASYIADDNPAAARSWLQKLRARARTAARDPGTGRKVPELGRDDLREVIVGNYRLGYRVTETEVVLLIVIEGHRQLGTIEEPGAG